MTRWYRIKATWAVTIWLGTVPAAGQPAATRVPEIDDLVTLQTIGSAAIAPDGQRVAFVQGSADFEADEFTSQLWLVAASGGPPRQMTRGGGSVSNVQWSPDGRFVSFQSTRHEKTSQVFAIHPDGGEAVRLTDGKAGVLSHAWAPDGRTLAVTRADEADAAAKAREQRFGEYAVVRDDYRYVHIWTVAVAAALESPQAGERLTSGSDWSVSGAVAWAPDGRSLAFSAARTPDLVDGGTADLFIVSTADGAVRRVVDQPGPDRNPVWAPDGRMLAFSTAMGDPGFYHANTEIAVVAAAGGSPTSLTAAFDEDAYLVAWTPRGLVFAALQRTAAHLFAVDPATRVISRLSAPEALALSSATLSTDGTTVAFVAGGPEHLPEVHVSAVAPFVPRRLTDTTAQTRGWTLGTREVVSWTSTDGEPIEGVLVKPADFDPSRRYPLLCVIHGGPTGIDRPTRVDARYYPVDLWAARGALVLKVNYRGSAGYGERFRRLNLDNLGVGDAWDVLSGIDALVARGLVDNERLGCMGWSQGGYISAFLTTSTTRFKAVSVGAGISNWATYYYNTDITPFTLQYLGGAPEDVPEIYRKTSPMTHIGAAATPTLIQHGEFDRRVPIANAYELRLGLERRGVPVEMVVYKGFGHGITKPRAMRAVLEHNLRWFNHYVFGDPLVPLSETDETP